MLKVNDAETKSTWLNDTLASWAPGFVVCAFRLGLHSSDCRPEPVQIRVLLVLPSGAPNEVLWSWLLYLLSEGQRPETKLHLVERSCFRYTRTFADWQSRYLQEKQDPDELVNTPQLTEDVAKKKTLWNHLSKFFFYSINQNVWIQNTLSTLSPAPSPSLSAPSTVRESQPAGGKIQHLYTLHGFLNVASQVKSR